ncbi:MAG: hypothetical protein R3331_00650 [Sulfurospirillaceae bacterium]|nr:hypothetical protein [Sulfurospirillaceae bacterium]
MNTWFTCNLGDAMLAGEIMEDIKTLFLSTYKKKNEPEDMAVFFRHESEGRLQCEVKIYFSPSAATIAQEFDAIHCKRPESQGLGLLAGSEKAKFILW